MKFWSTKKSALKQELFSGWKPAEVLWLIVFILTQSVIFYFDFKNDPSSFSVLGIIAGISGIICNVFVGKGKISNFLFGLIFAYSYFYVAWHNQFYGEMTTVLYVYLPAQFIGYFLWQKNLQTQGADGDLVKSKSLSIKGWLWLLLCLSIGTTIFYIVLRTTDGKSIGLDGLTTVLVVAGQLLMILRYNEQWLLWILVNVVSIALWRENYTMVAMYLAYLLNSIYGYYNWRKLSHSTIKE